uniref:Cytochrome P450 2k1b n=1 Tax=Lateolabrax maculatus TaxID=315492 RepID=A0A7T7FRN5_LATMC|nr:cytochrome P450 2k1b [Lateolabrax maculatus]
MLEELFQCSASVSLLAAIVSLLVLHLFYSSLSSRDKKREPPGPKPLPLLGNLLHVDLNRLDNSLFDLSKKYGPVFTVHFGLKKVVVLAGYRTVKQALVNHAEEFGDREITPLFYDFNKGHGILFTNGDSWKEMRRFALSTLRDFGMGKRISEGKIIEECSYLIEEFEQYEGKAFDNTQAICYAASNIVSAIMFGKRFEYQDPFFLAMVERDHESIRLTGSASILIYNMFPWLGPFLKNWRDLMKNVEGNKADTKRIIADLKETLNPEMCRCFIDAFLTRKLNLEASKRRRDPSNASSGLDNLQLARQVTEVPCEEEEVEEEEEDGCCSRKKFSVPGQQSALRVAAAPCWETSSSPPPRRPACWQPRCSPEKSGEPPGPKPLPLLGNLLQLDLQRPHITLLKLSKKYGSVFTVYFGPKKVVILAGYKTIKQALVNHAVEFGEREVIPLASELNGSHDTTD